MYWTLSTRPPTLEEIIFQGNARIRAAVEAVCARYDAPQIDVPVDDKESTLRQAEGRIHRKTQSRPVVHHHTAPGYYVVVSEAQRAAYQRGAFAQMAAQQDMNAYGLRGSQGIAHDMQGGTFGSVGQAVGTLRFPFFG